MWNLWRIICGAVAGPLLVALIWSIPAAFISLQWPLLALNFLFWLAAFAVCGVICHLVLRRLQWARLTQYVRVMFWVATAVFSLGKLAFLFWTFGNGGSEFHLGTQVMQQGSLTLGGLLLTIVEGMFGAAWLCGAFAVFWVIAVRPRTAARHDA